MLYTNLFTRFHSYDCSKYVVIYIYTINWIGLKFVKHNRENHVSIEKFSITCSNKCFVTCIYISGFEICSTS